MSCNAVIVCGKFQTRLWRLETFPIWMSIRWTLRHERGPHFNGTALTICFIAFSNAKSFHTFAGNALVDDKEARKND
ncbi:ubiquinol-cytochrome C chaperone domain protein [Brucella suis]|nr:ubiquinol-cytochrome C chaperone domain protein [Brucella suis]